MKKIILSLGVLCVLASCSSKNEQTEETITIDSAAATVDTTKCAVVDSCQKVEVVTPTETAVVTPTAMAKLNTK